MTIDSNKKSLSVDLTDSELAQRKSTWIPREIAYKRGALAKYARLVGSASEGAITG